MAHLAQTPLRDPLISVACKHGRLEIMKLLLAYGNANANARNTAGDTALMVAAARDKRMTFLRALLLEDVDVNARNYDGKTALMFATAAGRTTYAMVLLDAGAQVLYRYEALCAGALCEVAWRHSAFLNETASRVLRVHRWVFATSRFALGLRLLAAALALAAGRDHPVALQSHRRRQPPR